MTEMKQRTSWRNFLSRVPDTGPEPENVVPIRQVSLDEMAHELRRLQNAAIDKGIGAERAALAYNSARAELFEHAQKFVEMLKDHNIKGQYMGKFPECELYGDSDAGTSQ